jgi:DNA-directed RNA polymerase specialized sigma24 family protein
MYCADTNLPVPDTVIRPVRHDGHLTRLVARTAAGDRSAFRCLYGGLACLVWSVVAAILPPDRVAGVVEATFLEVWHRAAAFDAASGGPREWIGTIALRRADDRLRTTGGGARDARLDAIAAVCEAHHRLELAARLGPAPILIRVGPCAFVRVRDLAEVAAATVAPRQRLQNERTSSFS